MTKQLGQKEVAYVKYESNEQVGDIAINNQQLAEQIELFADTRLTALEESTFSRLKKDLQNLAKIEVEVAAGRAPVTGLFTGLASVRDGIDQLVEIQMREGRRELSISNKAIGSITLFGQIEIISLIIMAILIQIIILYTPKADTDT
jgi:hypothetical protein